MQWIKLKEHTSKKRVSKVCPLRRSFIRRDRSSERRGRGAHVQVNLQVNKIKILLTRVEAKTASALDLPDLGRFPASPAAATL